MSEKILEKESTRDSRMKKLVSSLFKIGCIGFGGGSALIPVLFQSTVKETHLVSQEDFDDDVVIASVTPGALPIEVSAGIGRQTLGVFGMLAGSSAIALPGAVITILIISLLSQFNSTLVRQINFCAVGVSAYILFVLGSYIKNAVRDKETKQERLFGIAVTAVVFILTCGKDLYRILGRSETPIFSISTVNVMAIAFFLILWSHGEYKPLRLLSGGLVALLYGLCIGKMELFSGTVVPTILRVAMLCMALWGLWEDVRGKKIALKLEHLPMMLQECLAALLLMVILAIPALFLYDGTLEYLLRGCISSLTSFGGGDAYLAMAGSMFVSTGLILYQDFYSSLVPVVNASPGSILCKVLSGMGYYLGYRTSGNIGVGFAVALAGFGCAIAMSCITFSIADFFYEELEQLSTFRFLKKIIRSIISGLLLTVGLGFIYSCLQTGQNCSWPALCAPILCLVLVVAIALFARKVGNRPVYMVLGSAACAFLCCNLLGVLF